jgi:hypothetical protein
MADISGIKIPDSKIAREAAEPPRVCRRPFGLSYAAMADCSSMA